MRYVIVGFCIFAAACAGTSPSAPTSSGMTSFSSQIKRGIVITQVKGAKDGSELPFKGTYEGLETVLAVPSHHHLDATGNATHLGRFIVTADWTLAATGNFGTSTWTAADGDEFSTSFARR